jgi:SAM-dependent methyltransferase
MEAIEYEVMAAVEDRHWWYSGMRALAAAWLDSVYGGCDGLEILDGGCGTGGNGDFLRRYGRCVGLDFERQALELGWRRLPGQILGGSVMALPFAAERFDLVTSFDVLYHRGVVDERVALREARRVLRPGGRLLLRLPAYKWLSSKHDRSVHGRHRYTQGEVRRVLEDAGFEVERLSYINSLLFPIPLLQRGVERFLPGLEQSGSDLEPPSPTVNALLRSALDLEAATLRRGGRFGWGLSVLSLARKPAEDHREVS